MTDAEYAKTLGDTVGNKVNPVLVEIKNAASTGLQTVDASVQQVINELKTLANIIDPTGGVRDSLAQQAAETAKRVGKAVISPMGIGALPFQAAGEAARAAPGLWNGAGRLLRRAGNAVLENLVPSAGAADLPGGGTYPHQGEVEAAAARHGVPAEWLAGVLAQESGFNPSAVGDNGNSWGMGQMNRRGGAAELGRTREQILSMSPAEQIDDVARFLRMNIDRAGGDVEAGVKRYNGGGDPNYLKNVRDRQREYGIGGQRAGASAGDDLRGVNPALVRLVKEVRQRYPDMPEFVVHDGVRTLDEQRDLVRSGRSRTMNSRHLSGDAVDLVPLVNGKPVWDWGLINQMQGPIKETAEELGIPVEWGGDWKRFKDGPHWQIPRDPESAYVPNLDRHLAAQANRGAQDRYGELTLNINQRVNGQTRNRTTQRLRAGSGVERPRHHGDVDLAGFG
jgi:hypothetical protein